MVRLTYNSGTGTPAAQGQRRIPISYLCKSNDIRPEHLHCIQKLLWDDLGREKYLWLFTSLELEQFQKGQAKLVTLNYMSESKEDVINLHSKIMFYGKDY